MQRWVPLSTEKPERSQRGDSECIGAGHQAAMNPWWMQQQNDRYGWTHEPANCGPRNASRSGAQPNSMRGQVQD